MDLTSILLDGYCSALIRRDAIQTFLKENPKMNQSTRDALERIAQALTAEIEEIRQIVKDGGDSTELDSHLNTLADNISGISDAIKSEPTDPQG